MSQQQFESGIKQIPYSQQRVYDKLSDLSHLEQFRDEMDSLSQDKLKLEDIQFDRDSASCSVNPVGRIELRIIEREEPKCIKAEATKSPIPLTLWVQIVSTGDESCKIKLTLRTELNILVKGMLQKPLRDGIDKLADILAVIPY